MKDELLFEQEWTDEDIEKMYEEYIYSSQFSLNGNDSDFEAFI